MCDSSHCKLLVRKVDSEVEIVHQQYRKLSGCKDARASARVSSGSDYILLDLKVSKTQENRRAMVACRYTVVLLMWVVVCASRISSLVVSDGDSSMFYQVNRRARVSRVCTT